MNAEQKRLAREILADAVEKPDPGERAAFIAQACGTDAELRQLVNALVQAHEQAGDFLHQTMVVGENDLVGEGPGTVIGRYKLLQQIGEGGFGRVFMAEQLEPVQRKVALKIIKAGMDTREVIGRFEAERQALALMDHPNIARVLDAGATESGRPYFVMELVKGIPITTYCDEHNLSTADGLQLFMQVCRAVQHAHQKGIIHRDLKPTNVLVTLVDGQAVPKVIDFGIAKAMGQRLTDRTLFTRFEQMIGTPAYMSPEQAALSGVDVDTRSDIYSLGVLLYELLTGTTPVERETLKRAVFDEIRRLVRETEPPKPSTRLQMLAKTQGSVASGQWSVVSGQRWKEVRGDLDWIVMKALEKERGRRYETANDFAEDIERHLKHEPVRAGPPSTAYRARKFIRRNRVPVAVASSVALALVAGLALALAGLQRARKAEAVAHRERDRAMQAEADAGAVLGFFQDKVLAATRPEGLGGGLGRQVTVRAAVDAAEPTIAPSFTNRPLVEARIRQVLGDTYRSLGDYRRAVEQQERSYSLFSSTCGTNDFATLNSVHFLGLAYDAAGRSQEAIPLLEENLKQLKARLDPNDPTTLSVMDVLAQAYLHVGRVWQALPLSEEGLERARARYGPGHEDTLVLMNNLATAYRAAGRPEDSLSLMEETLRGLRAAVGSAHPNTAMTMANVAFAYGELGRWEEAVQAYDEAYRVQKAGLGLNHSATLGSLQGLGDACAQLGQWTEAAEHYQTLINAAPDDAKLWYKACAAALSAGKTNFALTLSESMVARFGTNRNDRASRLLARTLAMIPALPQYLELALESSEAIPPENQQRLTSGILEYRLGRWLEASKRLELPSTDWNPCIGCLAGYFVAMTRHQLGAAAAARTALEEADRRFASVLHGGDLGGSWPDHAYNLLARAEAQRLVLGRETSPPVTAASLAAAREEWKPVRQALRQGEWLARQRKWKEARDGYVYALEHPAFNWFRAELDNLNLSQQLGMALLRAGDATNYVKFCQHLLASWNEKLPSELAEKYGKVCLINWNVLPQELGRKVVTLLRETEGVQPLDHSAFSYWFAFALGMAEYRGGNYPRALELLAYAQQSEEPVAGRVGCRGGALVFKAMALKRLDRPEAEMALAQAEELLGEPVRTRLGANWWDLDICELGLEEAREVIGQSGRK